MSRPRWRDLPLPLFVTLSVGLHAAAFRALGPKGPSHAETFEPRSRALTGETLDVEPAPPSRDEVDDAPAAATLASRAAENTPLQRSATTGPLANRGVATLASSASAMTATRPAVFGAIGVRFASDLATTFTRAFPQAASADPIWSTVPFGSRSSAEVTLVLDEDGHLARTSLAGFPSVALRRGIDRTLALLGTDRPFTAHGPVTRLRIRSNVTADGVHDGLHGDVFALSGGSFSGDVGNAFFALPPAAGPGRRIDVELRLVP